MTLDETIRQITADRTAQMKRLSYTNKSFTKALVTARVETLDAVLRLLAQTVAEEICVSGCSKYCVRHGDLDCYTCHEE